jgi:hypothetical protein
MAMVLFPLLQVMEVHNRVKLQTVFLPLQLLGLALCLQ